nr:hypothetical protein [uncultured bacterium]
MHLFCFLDRDIAGAQATVPRVRNRSVPDGLACSDPVIGGVFVQLVEA